MWNKKRKHRAKLSEWDRSSIFLITYVIFSHFLSTVYRVNMYDKFDLNNCIIVEETYDEVPEDSETETATVQFIAEMVLKETGEKTAFMETSKFEKAQNSGAWLYLSGEIEEVPSEDDGEGEDSSSEEDGKSVEEKLASQL